MTNRSLRVRLPPASAGPMQKGRFTEEQIVATLRQAGKVPMREAAKMHKKR
jgi:hypothetical protein